MGYAHSNALLEKFHLAVPVMPDKQTLFMCESNNFAQDFDTVLGQYKYCLLNGDFVKEQSIFEKYIKMIVPENVMDAMEDTLRYER